MRTRITCEPSWVWKMRAAEVAAPLLWDVGTRARTRCPLCEAKRLPCPFDALHGKPHSIRHPHVRELPWGL